MDILSMKNKSGRVSGQIFVNSAPLKAAFKRSIGFVDQHDMLMPTLTVIESIMFSALLRLPKTLTMAEKTQRVLTVLNELQLAHIADSAIGNEVTRGISGGEKRRVSVGMELVTQPKALFLDEPTSGLDTYNADLLVQILLELAQARGTAVILTVHQPRENIFARFNRLLLICKGERVFYGAARDVHSYFAAIGKPIPPAYNPADYLIDILFTHDAEEAEAAAQAALALEAGGEVTDNPLATAVVCEEGVAKGPNGGAMSKVAAGPGGAGGEGEEDDDGGRRRSLAGMFAASPFAEQVEREVAANTKKGENGQGGTRGRSPLLLLKKSSTMEIDGDAKAEAEAEKAARVSWLVEISVVSQRMFKDMLRKPSLTITHMVACIYYGGASVCCWWHAGPCLALPCLGVVCLRGVVTTAGWIGSKPTSN
jgi:ABC-type multidrug transport system ATPase subunit